MLHKLPLLLSVQQPLLLLLLVQLPQHLHIACIRISMCRFDSRMGSILFDAKIRVDPLKTHRRVKKSAAPRGLVIKHRS